MMRIFEILDRYELLYPTKPKIADLRRTYIDRDLNSIFRLVHDEELRKLILEDNEWKLWPVLERYTDTHLTTSLKSFLVHDIDFDHNSLSRGQIKSKKWLIESLEYAGVDYLGTVFLCAGWYAILAMMLFESDIQVSKVRNFDIDKSCEQISEIFNKKWFMDEWRYKFICDDIFNVDYNQHTWTAWSNRNNRLSKPITDVPDTIINTSCEHINNFSEWYNLIPLDKLVILQGNDYFDVEEHVNCSRTLKEFSEMCPMNEVLFEGELQLDHYKRFMKIGYR